MRLERSEARHTLEIDGETSWFCCRGCQEEFAQRAATSEVDHAGAAG